MPTPFSSVLSVGLLLTGVGLANTAHASEAPVTIASAPAPTLGLRPAAADPLAIAEPSDWSLDRGFGRTYRWGRRIARFGATGAVVGVGMTGVGLGLLIGAGLGSASLDGGLVLIVAGSGVMAGSLGAFAVGTGVATWALRKGGAPVTYLPLMFSGVTLLAAGIVDSRLAGSFWAASLAGVVVQSVVNRLGRDRVALTVRPAFSLQDRQVGVRVGGRW